MTKPSVYLLSAVLTLGINEAGECGVTGKIAGQVTDAEGNPLPGASVLIQGTRRGAEADADGVFFILSVEPGVYTLAGSMVWYESREVTEVVVSSDFTTNVSFELKVLPVMLEAIVVKGDGNLGKWERPPVEADRTTSKYTVGLSEIERMLSPARNIQEILQLQPGISLDGANRIRGAAVANDGSVGYSSDIAYIVDGVRMNHNDGRGHGGTFRSVNRGMVQELVVVTGVLPAEYGNIQGGVVQVVTKEGGGRFGSWAEFRYEPSGKKHWGEDVYGAPEHLGQMRWDDPEWLNEKWPALEVDDPRLKGMAGKLVHVRTDYTDQIGWDVETVLSGPVGERVSYAATVRHSRLANPFPGAERTGFYNDLGEFVASRSPGGGATTGSATGSGWIFRRRSRQGTSSRRGWNSFPAACGSHTGSIRARRSGASSLRATRDRSAGPYTRSSSMPMCRIRWSSRAWSWTWDFGWTRSTRTTGS